MVLLLGGLLASAPSRSWCRRVSASPVRAASTYGLTAVGVATPVALAFGLARRARVLLFAAIGVSLHVLMSRRSPSPTQVRRQGSAIEPGPGPAAAVEVRRAVESVRAAPVVEGAAAVIGVEAALAVERRIGEPPGPRGARPARGAGALHPQEATLDLAGPLDERGDVGVTRAAEPETDRPGDRPD